MGRIGEILRCYPSVARFEFMPAISVAILIGIFLGAPTFQSLLNIASAAAVAEGLVIFYLLFNTGFMVNCWADWEVDELYKRHLSKAVRTIGRATLGRIIAVQVALAVALTLHLVWLTGRLELLVLVAVGSFFGIGYSVAPFRFKTRGAWHSVMAVPVFAIPGTFALYLVRTLVPGEPFTALFLLVVFGITTAHYGLVLISQAEDTPDDRAAGLRTPGVAFGVERTLAASFYLNLLGSAVLLPAFAVLLYTGSPYLLLLLPLLAAGRAVATGAAYRLWSGARRLKRERASLELIRKAMKDYPKWHALPLGAVMLLSAALLAVRSLG